MSKNMRVAVLMDLELGSCSRIWDFSPPLDCKHSGVARRCSTGTKQQATARNNYGNAPS